MEKLMDETHLFQANFAQTFVAEADMSRPSKKTSPLDGASTAPIKCRNVLLPDPLGPETVINSPCSAGN